MSIAICCLFIPFLCLSLTDETLEFVHAEYVAGIVCRENNACVFIVEVSHSAGYCYA